ncbi:unnamed protein product [Lasius platythorax]|uniref:beta-glucosidase n=1 Tax=Lasius platythorax TaxID=488582 RepID=A0AAV2NT23_9HYME
MDFLLGTATAAYQIEGGWNESGKGESVWDWWTHENPSLIRDGSNGDVACDSLHKYKEDVQLLSDLGVDFYRFSISWPRILPTGYANVINQEGLNYYKNLINELLAKDIKPFVTLYHWDHPEIFERMGGWTNEMMVEWISDYARVVFKELGPKVKYFMSINEPNVLCGEGYGENVKAPGKNLGSPGVFLCMHNVLKAHAKIYHIYDKEFRKYQEGTIGIVLPCSGALPKNPNDTAAVNMHFQFNCGWIAHAIFSKTGDYPEIMKTHVADNSKLAGFSKSLLPELSSEWVQYIKGTSDFFGLNHYTSKIVETVPRMKGEGWYDFSGVKQSIDPSWPKSASDWLRVVPDGFREIIKKISKEYDNPPIYVMENGFSDKCCTFDHLRISYLYSYIKAMLLAIYEDGCNVKAYAVWSLLDNFEWGAGYTERFGLVNVNFTDSNRTRTPKWSTIWYKNIIATRKLTSIFNLPTAISVL